MNIGNYRIDRLEVLFIAGIVQCLQCLLQKKFGSIVHIGIVEIGILGILAGTRVGPDRMWVVMVVMVVVEGWG
jgi:hypothetical protein